MKALILVAMALGMGSMAQAQMAPEYYQIKSVEVKEVVGAPQFASMDQPGLGQECNESEKRPVAIFSDEVKGGALDELNVIVDQIINIGKKIWGIVSLGKPVMNVKFDTANALPKGLKCWVDLQGWSIPESKVYKVSYTNGFGANVVDFAFRVVYTAGGNLDGVGKYITNATMMPANIDVSWGFTLNADASVPSVFNMATKQAPVAGMQMVMNWNVETVLQANKSAETFYVGGDGTFKHLQ